MDHVPRPLQLSLLVAASALTLIAVVFGVDRLTNAGEILGDVEVVGVNLGGLDEEGAVSRLEDLEADLLASPVQVEVDGHEFSLDPASVSFDIREQELVDIALSNGRSGNVANQFGWWLGRFTGGDADLPLAYDMDRSALVDIISTWEVEGIADPADQGEIRVVNGNLEYTYPSPGTGIELSTAVDLLTAALADPERAVVTLPTRFLQPKVTDDDVDEAVSEAQEMIASEVTFTNAELGTSVVLPPRVLAAALQVTLDPEADDPEFEFSFDRNAIATFLSALGPTVETEPVDAEIVIDVETDLVTIVPSIPVKEPDPDLLTEALSTALEDGTRAGVLPYRDGREAEFSTEDAEALGIKELIGEFTTYHACCQNRVVNIQLIADSVDGVMIMPGEEFNLNQIAGQRTTEKGYRCAGAIVGGELVEEGAICIGGGTSQFTTTMYNAAFFAGLEDVAHTPHSIWFSRYPEGREATLGWQNPNLIFRNNTENAIIIRTTYTPTSITAKIYGDNGGLEVEAGLSNRYNHSSARGPIIRKNPDFVPAGPGQGCGPSNAVTVQNGSGGWSVDVYRYITYPDGTMTTETWSWHYTGYYIIKEWNNDHPNCDPPDDP